MSEKILVAREKHGDQYFGASTPEELAKSALKLLTSRWNEGYWYADPDDDGLGNSEWAEKRREDYLRALAMSQKEIDALPTNVQKEILNLRQEAKKDSEYDQKYRKWYEKAKKVVEDQDLGSYTLGRGRYERQEPKAWHLLKYRSDHEYEGVSLEEIH